MFDLGQNDMKDVFLYHRVLLCPKLSLRIANAAQQMASIAWSSSRPVNLFVEILSY